MHLRRLFFTLLLLTAASRACADNPFGVTLWPGSGQDMTMMAARAGALEVAFYAPPPVYVDRFKPEPNCAPCKAPSRAGMAIVLTVRNTGRDSAPRRPSAPPEDFDAYGRSIATILDQWHPAIMVVEEEENRLYRFAGTAVDYRKELETACKVAHSHGALCTNGGLSFESVTAVTWLALLHDNKPDQACSFSKRALYERGAGLCAYRRQQDVPPDLRERLLQGADALLPIYKDSPVDAVNFRWNGQDASALAQTIDAIGKITHKPVMSSEMSLRRSESDPIHVRPLMRAAMAGGMKVAIWNSIDGEDSTALFDEAGRLTPAGQEFAHQMSGRK